MPPLGESCTCLWMTRTRVGSLRPMLMRMLPLSLSLQRLKNPSRGRIPGEGYTVKEATFYERWQPGGAHRIHLSRTLLATHLSMRTSTLVELPIEKRVGFTTASRSHKP